MTYTPTWETIGRALERIIDAGLTSERAKLALCQEISDRNIGIRQHLAADRRRRFPSGIHEGLLNGSRISPEEIDWGQSRPSRRSPAWANSQLISDPRSLLSVVYEVNSLVERVVDRIEVRIVDVDRIFCASADAEKREAPIAAATFSAKLSNRDVLFKTAVLAIQTLWPEGIPEGLTPKRRNLAIWQWLKDKEYSEPKLRTILRAVKHVRSPRK